MADQIPVSMLAQEVAKEKARIVQLSKEMPVNTSLEQSSAKIVELAPVTQDVITDVQPSQIKTENPMPTKSGTTYLEINLPGANDPAPGTTTTPTLTEDEKRKRTIIGATILLAVIVLVIVMVTRKKSK